MWFEDAFYDPWIGRVAAVAMALAASFLFWTFITWPEAPVLSMFGAEVAARAAHAFTFWSAVFALLVRPPLPFLALASGCIYAILLTGAAAAAEETIRYVASGRSDEEPVAWALGALLIPVMVILGGVSHARRSHEDQPERSLGDPRSRQGNESDGRGEARRQSFVHRLSLNPWVVLFGTACSVVGLVLAVVPPKEMWAWISAKL